MAFLLRHDNQIRLPTLNDADYVHDIAYDYYGTRLALCTSSLSILIYSAQTATAGHDEGSGEWVEIACMKQAHTGPIWRLSWGPPDCGEPLASCSEDQTVAIWSNRSRTGSKSDKVPSWTCCQRLTCEQPILDVRFAPSPAPGSGLKLAVCTADGKGRIFRCRNEIDLDNWEHEDVGQKGNKDGKDGGVISAAIDWKPAPFGSGAGGEEAPEIIALAGRGGRLVIYGKGDTNHRKDWGVLVYKDDAHPEEKGGVKDLAWCPNLCRQEEIIATCGVGAKLWSFKTISAEERGGFRQQQEYQLDLLKELIPAEAEICPIWRCSWNLVGTALALCPEGAEVSVWKTNASLEWVQTSGISMSGNTDE